VLDQRQQQYELHATNTSLLLFVPFSELGHKLEGSQLGPVPWVAGVFVAENRLSNDRVATHLENLEKSRNLRVVREVGKVRENVFLHA